MELKRVMDDPREANRHECLQEQAALLLNLPQKKEVINAKLCRRGGFVYNEDESSGKVQLQGVES